LSRGITLSAIETGFPTYIRRPKPLPGETLGQLVIRNHPQEWRNFVDRLANEKGLSSSTCSRLLDGQLDTQDLRVRHEIEQFMNYRLPGHLRTLKSLADLREQLKKSPILNLLEIIWPMQPDPDGNIRHREQAERLGVTVIPAPVGPRELDLSTLLPHINGDFMWLVPGGTKFFAMLVAMSLARTIPHLAESEKRAFYGDGGGSFIYKVAVLRELLRRGQPLPANSCEMARVFHENGFELASNKNEILCELEKEYGGRDPEEIEWLWERNKDKSPSWWQRLFHS
jgi:hypothetical protein